MNKDLFSDLIMEEQNLYSNLHDDSSLMAVQNKSCLSQDVNFGNGNKQLK